MNSEKPPKPESSAGARLQALLEGDRKGLPTLASNRRRADSRDDPVIIHPEIIRPGIN